ncbi:MAG: putative S-layer protein [Candidatus Pacearchaeota archaeon]
MNFTKVFSLFALLALAILSVSAVSAVVDITGTNISSVVSGSQTTFNLNVIATSFSGTFTNAQLILPNVFGASTSWSGDTGTFTLSPSSIVPRTVTLSVPAGQTPGTYTGLIDFTGTYSGTGTIVFNALPITLTVTSPPTSTNLSITVQGTQPFLVGQNATLNVANPNGLTVTMSEIGSNLAGVTFAPSVFSSASQTVQAILTNLQNLEFGINTVTVQATSGSQTTTKSFEVRKTFCSAVPINSNLTIKSIDISNDGEGDEDKWELLDEIDVELEIENNNQDDDIDVIAELGLYDSSGKNIADDLEFTSGSDSDNEEIEINVDEDDSVTVNFKFKVPADFDTGNYQLAFKVYDDDLGESKSCRDTSSDLDESFFQTVEVVEASDEGRFVIVDDFNIDSQVVCGTTLSGQFTIFNVGEEDQDRVRVLIRNNELNINEAVEFTSDLDQGDEETLSFSVRVPNTATNGIKNLEFITEYDYKNGVYREDSEEAYVFGVEVIGCSGNLGGTPTGGLTDTTIEAELSSDAKAGQELVVVATITNNGNEEKDYTINARDYSDWAELTDISDGSFSLDAGESKEVEFTFLVNEDSTGSNAFDIQVTSESRTQVQEVEVELEEASSGFNLDLKGNSTLWIIGLVNLVLIILIIVVAVRLSRK